jgi:hypothetical protein
MLISLGVTALLLVVFTRGRLGYRPEAAARELMARQYRA